MKVKSTVGEVMGNFFALFLFLFSILFSCGSGCAAPGLKGTIFPVYFYDTEEWSRLAGLECERRFYAIVNPASGPGEFVDQNYVKFINQLRENGKIPVGYVYTKWGERSIDEVKADVDRWLELYPRIRGFFVDEVATSKEKLPYYQELYSYIKSKNSRFKVILNPGTAPDEDYFSVATIVVIYESSIDNLNYLERVGLRRKSACIVYGVPEERVGEVVEKVKKACSYLFVTDGDGANPYDHIPPYFQGFLNTYITK